MARAAIQRLPNVQDLPPQQARKIRQKFDKYVAELCAFRENLDLIHDPKIIFDPANSDTIGRLVAIALLVQDRIPLAQISATYGSGIYAIYYEGPHPAYSEISGKETPIYVGKADPKDSKALTPREQGPQLFTRLAEHRKAIQAVESHALANALENSIKVEDFTCRKLVCATNAQLAVERLLIGIFNPVWNQEGKICFGISKHGDSSNTRQNNKSPWDVLHPGRSWALPSPVKNGMIADTIMAALAKHFTTYIPVPDLYAANEKITDSLRQFGRTSAALSEAAARDEEVTSIMDNISE